MRVAIPVVLILIAIFSRSAFGQNQTQNQTETFLLRMPDGFKVGFQKANMAEWVPAGQTVDDWSEMITIQVYRVSASVTQAKFLGRAMGIVRRWQFAVP